jgi:DNA-binding Xre family transcriptional regulator
LGERILLDVKLKRVYKLGVGKIIAKIQEKAIKRGYKNANRLREALECSPDVSARLWRGDFKRIDVATLAKLCDVLRCQPKDLLAYEKGEND